MQVSVYTLTTVVPGFFHCDLLQHLVKSHWKMLYLEMSARVKSRFAAVNFTTEMLTTNCHYKTRTCTRCSDYASEMRCFVYLSLCVTAVHALSLTPCKQYFDVVEGRTDNVITCSQLSGLGVVWKGKDDVIIGECPAPQAAQTQDTCTDKLLEAVYNPVRTSPPVSTLTINPTSLASDTYVFESLTLKCETRNSGGGIAESQTCKVDYVDPAAVTSCTVQLSRWSVTGSCSISKMFSSRGRYTCQWYQQRGSSTATATSSATDIATSPIPGGKYKSGTCTLSAGSFPSVPGVYRYSVVIYPGGQRHDAVFTGSLESSVELPVAPTVSCTPSDYVRENTDVTCTCRTSSVGKPTGRLTAVIGTGNNINTPVGNHGNYGVTTLQLPALRLVRGDHNTKKLRCVVDWARSVPGNVYTFKVGFALSQATLLINSTPGNMTVTEGNPVTFDCSGSGGRPDTNATTLTSDVTNRPLAKGSASVTHTVDSAECDHSAHYTCTAGNGMGPDVSVTRNLLVNCKPQTIPTRLPAARFTSKVPSVLFNVTAYPGPIALTFGFLGTSAENNVPQTDYKGIQFGSSCQPINDRLNLFTCVVTVYSVTPAVVGFYQVTASNSLGSTTLVMEVLLQDPETRATSCSSNHGVIIALGVVLALIVIVSIVFIIWVWKRRWILPCADVHSINNSKRVQYEAKRSTDQNFEVTVTQSSLPRAPEGPYESLDMSEVAQRSIYSDISPDVAKA